MEICMQETYQFDICKGAKEETMGKWSLSYQEFANEASACLTENCTGIALQSHPESRQGGCTLHWVLDTCSSWGG